MQLRLGGHLTKLTSIFERLDQTRREMPIGAGGGIDSLPKNEGLAAAHQLEASYTFLRKIPRHEVTAALLKNFRLAEALGRPNRAFAIGELLQKLTKDDLAMDLETFMKSYA